jgi:alkylation response protein AidB-like acyl-CoA dehydrogenase
VANYLDDNDDLLYYLERGIDWDPIVEMVEQGYKAPQAPKDLAEAVGSYRDILQMVGTLAAEEVAPRAAAIDRKGVKMADGEAVMPPEMDQLFAQFKSLDLHGLALPREFGGSNCPMIVYFMVTELLARADVSVLAHYSFHSGIAACLLVFSAYEGSTQFDRATHTLTGTRWAAEIAEIVRGDAWGSMDITEPDAGSDMGALKSRGEQDEHGDWFVSGQKIFITSGHGKYHVVIARTEKPSATDADGPRRPVAVPGPGLRGPAGRHAQAPGHPRPPRGEARPRGLGDRRDHLRAHARAAHRQARRGLQAHAPAHEQRPHRRRLRVDRPVRGAYRLARAYAAERRSMGKTIDRHEMIADYLDEMRTDIQGLRAMAMHAAVHEELGQRTQDGRHVDRRRGQPGARAPAEAVAPVRAARPAASRPSSSTSPPRRPSRWRAAACRSTAASATPRSTGPRSSSATRWCMPIYEGTSQIQSLMAMKDAMSAIMKNPQKFLTRVAQSRWRSLSALDPLERRVARLTALSLSAQQHLIQRTATDKLRSLGKHKMSEWSQASCCRTGSRSGTSPTRCCTPSASPAC